MTEISDERLIRYLDGDLSDAEAAAIEAAIAADPDLQLALEALSPDIEGLRSGMDALLVQAPEMPELPLPSPVPARRPVWQVVAAAVVLFSLGLGVGTQFPGSERSNTWHQAVADYQVLYTTATLTAVPMAPDLRKTGLSRTSEALGLDLSAEAIRIEGLTFQRAQILEVDGRPLAQLVYLDPAGTPVAFCITRRPGVDVEPQSQRLSGLNARVWQRDGYGFILIGDLADDTLKAAETELVAKIAI